MALRIKSKWHDSGRNSALEKGLDENAGALAFICWRIALDKAKNLHGEDYLYSSDGQRIAVICEFLAYQIQIADRIAHRLGLSDGERRAFVTALGVRVAEHVEDNARDLFGPGDYTTGFIETLNERSTDYAELGYTKAGPSHSFTRYLGSRIESIMGGGQTNKWVFNQVMEIDAAEVAEKTEKAMDDLFATSTAS